MSFSAPKLFPHDIFRPEHFDQWVKANRASLVNSARQWVGADAAEDCVQAASIAAWQSLCRLPNQCPLSDFLKFFRNKLRDACRAHIQQTKRRGEVLLAPEDVLCLAERMSTDSTLALPDLSHPYYKLLREELYERLERVTLTAKQELCIRQWLNGVTQEGIAAYLTISQEAVRAHIGAATEKLSAVLYWEIPVEREIWDFFWECVAEVEASIYIRPSRSRKKFLKREKKEIAS